MTGNSKHETVQASLRRANRSPHNGSTVAQEVDRLARRGSPEVAAQFLFGRSSGEGDRLCQRDGQGYSFFAAMCSPGNTEVIRSVATHHHWSDKSEGCVRPDEDGTPVMSFHVHNGEWLIVEAPAVLVLLAMD